MPCSTYVFVGSSPHTRGAPDPAARADARAGIIPAYAGSTRYPPTGPPRRPDHPRIRGEHVSGFPYPSSSPGSSPHTRGAPTLHARSPASVGIIPAYAGSTAEVSPTSARVEDHPRIRGEHCPPSALAPLDNRIIPAYAGSTCIRSPLVARPQDHPRIRGEHSSRLRLSLIAIGSSPHTRGAHRGAGREQLQQGIIPAYAGSTHR